MNDDVVTATYDRRELAAMLVFLQAAMGVVTVVGAVVVSVAFASPGMALMTVAMSAGTLFWLVLGAALLRRRRWARRTTRTLQWIGVAGGLIGIFLQVGTGVSLVALCTNLGLPLLVIYLLRPTRSTEGGWGR